MTDVNYIFLLSLSIIALGYVIKRLNIITEENGKVVAKIIFNVTLPAVILKVTSSIEFSLSLLILPLINICFGFFMAGIGMIIFRNQPNKQKGLVLISLIGFNVAHFSFPLIEGIYGEEGLQYIALVDAGNAFTIFVFCYVVGLIFSQNGEPSNGEKIKSVDYKHIAKRLIRSAPLLSYIAALVINFSGLSIPMFVGDLLDVFYRANTALSLLLLGIYLNFRFEKSEWATILKVLVMRYSFGLVLGLSLFFLLPPQNFPHLMRIIIVISLILPVGLAVIPFSVEFRYNEKLISIIVNLTIIISFALMWILILLLEG
ncbi:MAG: AEC family transporter [Candidatus Lokiarchaeota archaeon]|nr:AEC family transporter [Candidatus Lokiarchaeota archaeon]MBD3342396.1 AEC family transporter [Candidatus Lokiarchaeota archaeon]